MLSNKTLKFLQERFAEYYRRYARLIRFPPALEKREYGFSLFGSGGINIRHKRFERKEDLRMFLELMVPSDAYYSAAYYERPEERMDLKGWIGADLIFDIDADHVETQCKEKHDVWSCLDCGYSAHGKARFCPACGSERIWEEEWLCDVCLEATKAEVLRLIDLLITEFGFSEHELVVCFSGHRGYHLHIESEDIRSLDQMARKEIVDYICGIGLVPRYHGLYERSIGRGRRVILGPGMNDGGWRSRLAKGVYEFLVMLSEEYLRQMGLKRGVIEFLLKEKSGLLEKWEKHSWQFIKEVGGVRSKTWKRILDVIIRSQAISIDVIVTTDIHRLIRLPNTLHGKTGLKAKVVSVSQLEGFDPLAECIVFSESDVCTIHIKSAPKFRVGQQTYGPYRDETVVLPHAAAIYLMLKAGAELV